jgi:hypothetical protein
MSTLHTSRLALETIGCLVVALGTWGTVGFAQDEAPPPAAEAAAPATAASLPDYCTGTNPAEGPAKWPDPTGAAAGTWASPSAGPVGDGDPALKTVPELYDRIIHNLFSINVVWAMVTGFLVMFMQAGFAMVEGGLSRAKNASHTMA